MELMIRRRREVIPVICIADPNGYGYDILRPIKPTVPSPTPAPKPVPVERDFVSDQEAGVLFRSMPLMRPPTNGTMYGAVEHGKPKGVIGFSHEKPTSWKGWRQSQHR